MASEVEGFGVAALPLPSSFAQSTRTNATKAASITSCSAIPNGDPSERRITSPKLSLAKVAPPT